MIRGRIVFLAWLFLSLLSCSGEQNDSVGPTQEAAEGSSGLPEGSVDSGDGALVFTAEHASYLDSSFNNKTICGDLEIASIGIEKSRVTLELSVLGESDQPAGQWVLSWKGQGTQPVFQTRHFDFSRLSGGDAETDTKGRLACIEEFFQSQDNGEVEPAREATNDESGAGIEESPPSQEEPQADQPVEPTPEAARPQEGAELPAFSDDSGKEHQATFLEVPSPLRAVLLVAWFPLVLALLVWSILSRQVLHFRVDWSEKRTMALLFVLAVGLRFLVDPIFDNVSVVARLNHLEYLRESPGLHAWFLAVYRLWSFFVTSLDLPLLSRIDSLRLVTAVLGALVVPGAWILAGQLGARPLGRLLGAAILATLPVHVLLSSNGTTVGLSCSVLVVGLSFLVAGLKKDHRPGIVIGLLWLSVFTQFRLEDSALLGLAVIWIFSVDWEPLKAGLNRNRRTVVLASLATSIILIPSFLGFMTALSPEGPPWFEESAGTAAEGFVWPLVSPYLSWSFNLLGLATIVATLRRRPLLVLWMFAVHGMAHGVLLGRFVPTDPTDISDMEMVLPTLTIMVMMMALGVQGMVPGNWKGRRYLVALAVIMVVFGLSYSVTWKFVSGEKWAPQEEAHFILHSLSSIPDGDTILVAENLMPNEFGLPVGEHYSWLVERHHRWVTIGRGHYEIAIDPEHTWYYRGGSCHVMNGNDVCGFVENSLAMVPALSEEISGRALNGEEYGLLPYPAVFYRVQGITKPNTSPASGDNTP